MINYFIRDGYVEKVSNKDSENRTTGFDLKRWLKKLLTFLNVTFYDKCCDEGAVTLPVRANTTTGFLQVFDGTAWVDTDVAFTVA